MENSSPVPQRTLVMQFGGTSVGSTAALKQVIQVVKDTRTGWQRVVVFISALSGVTDEHFRLAHPGTRTARRHNKADSMVIKATATQALGLICLEGRGKLGIPGVAVRTFAVDTHSALNSLYELIVNGG